MIGVPGYADRPKGGWRRHDAAVMVKVLFWRRCANLGDERTGFQPGEPAPDQKTVCLLRDKRTRAGALKALVCGFRRAVAQPGLQAHRRPGSGRPADCGPATTDDRGRESPRQGRWEWPGHLAGGSGQGGAQRHRCALDGQIFQGPQDKDGQDDAGPVAVPLPRLGGGNPIAIDRKWGFAGGETGAHGRSGPQFRPPDLSRAPTRHSLPCVQNPEMAAPAGQKGRPDTHKETTDAKTPILDRNAAANSAMHPKIQGQSKCPAC